MICNFIILIMFLRSEDFEVLKSSVLNIVKLQNYSLSGVPLTRTALICDRHPEIIKKQEINRNNSLK
jgi:hypothetical protein